MSDLIDNIPEITRSIDNFDETLQLRDSKHFRREWDRIHKLVQRKAQNCIQSVWLREINEEADMLHKIYARAINAPKFDVGIIKGIADDFTLIYKALILDIVDPWLDNLIIRYENSVFPCGKL